jgi:hypothetical protein
MTTSQSEHQITIEAVHAPDSEHPYAARCSCGLRWHVPDWAATAEEGSTAADPAERARTVAEAVERAKATFRLWTDLHPTVPAPKTGKPRPEVVEALTVRLLTVRLLSDLDEDLFDLEELVVAYEATTRECNKALDRALGLNRP